MPRFAHGGAITSIANELLQSREICSVSASGGKKGVKPERMSLISPEALRALARVYDYGATKYGDPYNYRKGYEWSKTLDAMLRHVVAFMDGENLDPESELPHIAHAMWHCAAMLTFMEHERYAEYDDRSKT